LEACGKYKKSQALYKIVLLSGFEEASGASKLIGRGNGYRINPKSPLVIIMNSSEESSGKACALYWFLLALP